MGMWKVDELVKKSEKHSFVILSDSEESDIIEILLRSAPQNDTTWAFYECINILFLKNSKSCLTKIQKKYRLAKFIKKVGICLYGRK